VRSGASALVDFRYHLVSIIAVFLALAVGIVVGTTALNGYVVDSLRASNKKVIHDKRGLESQVKDLRNQVSRREQFADAVAPEVVGGQLSGERVLLVTTPGASDGVIKSLTALVTEAGGATTGQVSLRADLLDPTKAQVVDDVVASVAPAGVTLPEGTAGDRAAVELAAALLTSSASTRLPEDAAAKVLGGFAGADLVDVQPPPGSKSGTPLGLATLAVLVTGGADGHTADDVTKQRQRTVLTLARAMDLRSAGVVVVGPESAAGTGGLIEALRRDGGLSDRVSSVDAVDTSYGAVSAILALHEQATGRSGRYGQGPGSQAAAPALTTQ
jgi:hypothetical protein